MMTLPVVAGPRREAAPARVGAASSLRGVALGAALALAGVAPAVAQAPVYQAEDHAYRAVTVADGLENPWGLAILPNGDMLVTERPGRLRIIRNGALAPNPIAGTPEVWARGQGGLLDVVLHPEFAQNRLVYLSYSKPGPDGKQATTGVVRGRFEGDRLTGVQEIFVAEAWSERGQHFGSRLAFDRDGYLFVTVGDRGDRTDLGEKQNAQTLTNDAGKVHRLHDDGRIPADNPFVNHPTARKSIYTYGNRNPQGLVIHPATGQPWAVEHGPRGGDEVNLLQPGRNYGWPVITYGINYNGTPITDITERQGMEQPLHKWVPSIATSGMTVYTGDKFPQWKGDVFVGGLAGLQLARLKFDGSRVVEQEKLMEEYKGRIRDVRTGPDGNLYVLIDAAAPAGEVLRLEPATR